jgi:hypothetical protein
MYFMEILESKIKSDNHFCLSHIENLLCHVLLFMTVIIMLLVMMPCNDQTATMPSFTVV